MLAPLLGRGVEIGAKMHEEMAKKIIRRAVSHLFAWWE
jgi:hypothetical protein